MHNTVKVFQWKVANEALPTKKNIYARKVIDSGMCPICELVEESTSHALWTCNVMSDVWADSQSLLHKWPCIEEDFFNSFKEAGQQITEA